jgi:hypothetical protein
MPLRQRKEIQKLLRPRGVTFDLKAFGVDSRCPALMYRASNGH